MKFTPELGATLITFLATFLAVLVNLRQQTKIEERANKQIELVAKRLDDRISDTRDLLRAEMREQRSELKQVLQQELGAMRDEMRELGDRRIVRTSGG